VNYVITAPSDLTLQTNRETDTVASLRGKNRETNYRRYYRYHRHFKSKIPVYSKGMERDGGETGEKGMQEGKG